MSTGRPASMASLVSGLAAGLVEVRATTSGGRTQWSRRGVTFAALEGDGILELRLDRAVAAAALKTPDTALASRGMPWLRFAPQVLDGHAIDRATAWFGLAYRRAAEA